MSNHSLELNTGASMPLIGLGTYRITGRSAARTVAQAIQTGYRLIDTAQWYDNEDAVGAGIRESRADRETLFITTKSQTSGYHSTARGVDQSLMNAKLDYFDLMLIHWPMGDDVGTYRALEDAMGAGKVRAIGISNFTSSQTLALLEHVDVVPAVNQIETHLHFQQRAMHAFLQRLGIAHQAWSPFGEGNSRILQDPVVEEIAAAHGRTPGQVLLSFYASCGISAIPKASTPAHMKENLEALNLTLTTEERAALEARDRRKSIAGWPAAMHAETDY